MTLNNFVDTYTGKRATNNHGNFPGECVSLASRYAQEVQSVPNADAVLYCQTTGGARDLYENPTALTLRYYNKIPFGQPRQRGDLVVWGGNLGKYGDVAIALDSSNTIFGQLGTPVFIPANTRQEIRQPLGYLRLKGDDMVQDQDVRNLWPKMFAGAPAKDADIKKWSGKSFKDFFYGVAGGPEFAAQQADFISWKKVGITLSKNAVELKSGNYFVKEK